MNDGAAALFASAALYARELRTDEVPRLQAFFDANPGYFIAINGRPPHPDEAQSEFDEMPPAHLGYSRRWFLGLYDRVEAEQTEEPTLAGVAIVVSDLGANGVWHLALFFVDGALQGRGVAGEVYAAMETWVRAQGARWLRLSVVEGNQRAQRFWSRQGFQAVRSREGIDTGGRLNTVHVLVKPMAAEGDLAAYLELMPRDRPGSTLP
jgi:GNAT superfamily N-acetyltransferase